jgi:3-oxoacyl-[acyl-carrier protein] reductase
MEPQQRIALVMGGSRGIGAGIVRRLAQDGLRVAFTYVQAKARADELADEVGALAIQADSGDPDATKAAVDRTAAAFGGLDILVNNAFTADVRPLAEFQADAFDRMIAVNVRGPWLAIQAASAHLGQGGRIINIGSIFAERLPSGPNTGIAIYNTTKAALSGMTRALARELGPRGITVNIIQPGAIDTEALDEQYAVIMRDHTPLGHIGDPSDIAGLVAYLVKPEARFVTGATLTVDGGFSA